CQNLQRCTAQTTITVHRFARTSQLRPQPGKLRSGVWHRSAATGVHSPQEELSRRRKRETSKQHLERRLEIGLLTQGSDYAQRQQASSDTESSESGNRDPENRRSSIVADRRVRLGAELPRIHSWHGNRSERQRDR